MDWLADQTPDDYDPPAHERAYLRRTSDGQLAWLVRREGVTKVKLDRANQEIILPYIKAQWIEVDDHRPLNRYHVAQIAFLADQQLCRALGLHDKTRRSWDALKDDQRKAWLNKGPVDRQERSDLWNAIMTAMAPHSR